MRPNFNLLLLLLLLPGLSGCEFFFDRFHDPKPRQVEVTNFASGLRNPFGIEVDALRQVWVTEAGSGTASDGQLTLITPQGVKYPAVQGFASFINPEGVAGGLNHLLLQDGILWILHGIEGRLYKFNIHTFKIGDAPLPASSLAYENVGAFVRGAPSPEPIEESNLFNLTLGPGGDLYMVDAGANAIIRRKAGSGELSVFAFFPDLDNPGAGPPSIDVVPTGIVFDGRRFLVSTFTGFPFLPGMARIYQVDLAGNVSLYQAGFNGLTDLELGYNQQPLATEYGTFGAEGFNPGTGRLVLANRSHITPLLGELNFPTAIKKIDPRSYYLGSSSEGRIWKVRQK